MQNGNKTTRIPDFKIEFKEGMKAAKQLRLCGVQIFNPYIEGTNEFNTWEAGFAYTPTK